MEARERAGLTIAQAAERMPSLSPQGLRHLEGRTAGREAPDGRDLRLCTVLDVIRVYWPELNLEDFMPETSRPQLEVSYR